MRFRGRPILAALLAACALAGCGGGDDGSFGLGTAPEPNATDAAFARSMLAHQRTTGAIARIAARKARRRELRRIAKGTLAHHEDRMRELARALDDLRGRGVSPLGAGIAEPPPFDAHALRNAISFDHDFMTRMIQQLEYTVKTAALERDRGADPRLRALAQAMYKSSRRDLAMLRRWLRTWYEPTQPNVPRQPPPGGGGGGGGGKGPGPEV